ncbi:DNA-binding response regulator, partial [Nocardiopsis tropica]|nr:DNA-binding response regulator [Nocardiopsis tropica]
VKTHLMRVYDKLGVGDRTAAVSRAIRRGLLPDR